MTQTPLQRFNNIFNNGQQVLKSVKYLRKQKASATENALPPEQIEQLNLIEALGYLAVGLAANVYKWPPSPAQSLGAASLFNDRQNKAYDIAAEVTTVAQVQAEALLALVEPMRAPSSTAGGAMSMSMSDPVQDALDRATVKLLTALPLLETSFSADTQFGADTPAAKFFAYLYAHKPSTADEVGNTLDQALSASAK
jgi:hypothetical protein